MKRRALLVILGLAVGSLCLWLSSRLVDWQEASRILRIACPFGITVGIALFGADIVLRALRWRTILAFRMDVTLSISLWALLAGFAANVVLPARLGEFYRAHFLSRYARLSGSAIFASIVIERLLDLFAAISALALGLVLAGGGNGISHQVLTVAATVAIAAVVLMLLIVLVLSRRSDEDLLRLLGRLCGGAAIAKHGGSMLVNFTQALQCVRTRHFLVAILWTVPIWALEAGAMWSICRAVGMDLGVAGTLAMVGGVALSTMVPSAPGYVGSYQMAFVVILDQFGVGATTAVVGATAVQIYLIGGFTLLGLVVIAVTTFMSKIASDETQAPRQR